MIASEIIRAVSHDLNDQEPGYEFEHWSYAMLKHYLLESLIQLSQQFYKLFIKRFTIKVEPGAVWQQACCECDQIVRIVGETNEDGTELIHTLGRVTDNPDNEWPIAVADVCKVEPEDYEMTGASISNVDGRFFRVVPSVPKDGKPHYISIECYTHIHDVDDNDEIYWRFIPLVKLWMIGRAYLVDGENNPAMLQLGKHYLDSYTSMVSALMNALTAEDKEKDFESDVRTVPNGSSN